jgi:hypothetical protein
MIGRQFVCECLIGFTLSIAFQSVRAADVTQDSIARVEVRGQTESGPYIRFGTGFLVGKEGALLTARHLVVPEHPWVKDDVTGTLRAAIYVTMRDNNGMLNDRRPAYVQKEDERSDIAVLKIDGARFNSGLATCPEQQLSGAPSVLIRGFPASSDGSSDRSNGDWLDAVQGIISDAGSRDNGRLRVSAATRPGFSGAPVLVGDKAVGLLTGGTDGRLTTAPFSTFTPLQLVRGKMLAECAVACRHSDNGVESYKQTETWGADSGWRSGGSSPGEFCGAQLLARGKQFPDRKVNLLSSNEDARWTGFMNRDREYRYSCSFRDDWNPTYKLALTPACEQLAGSSPLPR